MLELIYNELKRNNITIPYKQIEYRERTDEVKMPFVEKALPERVEKEREKKIDFDLENIDIAQVIEHRKQKRAENKANKHKKQQTKKQKTKKEV